MRRRTLAIVALAVALSACGREDTSPPTVAASPTEAGVLAQIPTEARVATPGAEPRTGDYWVAWSTCGEGSQAAVAEANGGREAGWITLDDLLEEPGVALAGQRVRTCQEAIAVLDGLGQPDVVSELAAQSLTSEVNLSAGAETCVASDGVVQVARALLASVAYDRPGSYSFVDTVTEQRARETTELLASYNSGALCQGA